MKSFDLERWLGQIYATEEEELSCSDCFDLVSEYVEGELAHTALDEQMRQIRQHLGQCRVCREEYQVLREIVAQSLLGDSN